MLKKLTPFLSLVAAFAPITFASTKPVEARVYPWADAKVTKTKSGEVREILEGSSRDLKEIDITAITVEPGKSQHVDKTHDDEEYLIIKSGQLDITIGGETTTLGPGSVALFIPGEKHSIANSSDGPATYFLFEYESVAEPDLERAAKAGGSFFVDWDSVEYNPSEIGGRRNFFDRPTAMCSYFEMHYSTVNPGLSSHKPHTHRAAEIILMTKGEAEMLIGENHYKAKAGDLFFVQSEIPHSLQNIGNGPTEYYAYQWQ